MTSEPDPVIRFIEQTKYRNLSPSGQQAGLPQPPLELPCEPDIARVVLPKPIDIRIPDITLRQAVEQRTTRRDYAREPITLEELSYLLWMTQGVRLLKENKLSNRTVPSAGARHCFETYLAINQVNGLEPGLYRYLALSHTLATLRQGTDFITNLKIACRNQEHVANSAVTFMWVCVLERMTWRYSERSFRYLFLDAGHVCQNLYLAAGQIGCGVCAIAAFNDDDVNALLELDGSNLFAAYLASLGRIRTD